MYPDSVPCWDRSVLFSSCRFLDFGYLLSTMVSQAQNNEHEEDNTLTLPDGVDIPVRSIQPDDVPALQRFHSRLSERTVYLRFFGPMEEFSEEKARYFAHTDGVDHVALVALDPDEPDEIIAVVRYDREPGSERAEYAALVEDRWQGRGLGMRLTHMLIDRARDKGVHFLYGLVMPQNGRMLNLLRDLDLPEQERRENGAKYVEVEL
jgi:GNAT superfamily N-acetyltransferase